MAPSSSAAGWWHPSEGPEAAKAVSLCLPPYHSELCLHPLGPLTGQLSGSADQRALQDAEVQGKPKSPLLPFSVPTLGDILPGLTALRQTDFALQGCPWVPNHHPRL